jgi:hypothetical protein
MTGTSNNEVGPATKAGEMIVRVDAATPAHTCAIDSINAITIFNICFSGLS